MVCSIYLVCVGVHSSGPCSGHRFWVQGSGPKDQLDMRIPRSSSTAEIRGIPETMVSMQTAAPLPPYPRISI